MSHVHRILAALLLPTLLLAGCSHGIRSDRHVISREATLEEIRRTLEVEADAPPAAPEEPPPEVVSALVPELSMRLPEAAGGAPIEQRFDLSVERSAAQPFFSGLVEGTPYNMIVHPDVEGRITLDLKNVTVEEVLEIVREVYGYEYQRTRSGFIVLPARLQSRIFHVDYLNVKRGGQSSTRVSSGQSTQTDEDAGLSLVDSGTAVASSRGGRRAMTSSKIVTENEHDYWAGLAETLSTIIGGGEGRSVVVDPQAGLVVVRAMPGELREVEEYLVRAQANLQRQVILEAKIVEVELNDQHRTGIDWAAIGRSDGTRYGGGSIQLINGDSRILNDAGDAVDPSRVFKVDEFERLSNAFFFGIGGDDFAALLRLLSAQGDVHVLSSPRVSTVNNQKAVIKVGSDEFFVTDVSSTTVTGTATTTTPNIELTPFFSGIALDVTPQIGRDDEVILHIHPTVSEVQDQIKQIRVAGQEQALPLAFSTVREADSIVRARSGQVIVIGGLMQDRALRQDSRTPGLGDVPVMGNLFRQNERRAVRSELVILLRPVVVRHDNTWREEIRRSGERIEAFERSGRRGDEAR